MTFDSHSGIRPGTDKRSTDSSQPHETPAERFCDVYYTRDGAVLFKDSEFAYIECDEAAVVEVRR